MTELMLDKKPYLAALDSDGSVFPNMPLKYEAMRDSLIENFGWQQIAPTVEEVVRFFNLQSRWRGSHRLLALLQIVDALRAHPDVQRERVTIPRLEALRQYVAEGRPLSHAGLEVALAERNDPELRRVLEWSKDLSERLARLPPVRPVPEVLTALSRLATEAVWVVVSQAPEEQLRREWSSAGLAGFVDRIQGAEFGPKDGQIRHAIAEWGITPDKTLVIGDSVGDLEAARVVGAAFYPILPDREAESWRLLLTEVWPAFREGRYRGAMEEEMAQQLLAALPETPPWAEQSAGNPSSR